jgi:hypothetical protein
MEATMGIFNCRTGSRAWRTALPIAVALAAVLVTVGAAAALAANASPDAVLTNDGVETLALKWFALMQTGRIDRTQLSTGYSAQLTDGAVQDMSRYLKQHNYGASPARAEIVRTRTIDNQRLYVVEIVFPRGDAASLLFGFNPQGKITGISLLSMAGD